MSGVMSGRGDVLYCNAFLDESVNLLINSVFLFEDGYFDCAFYSIRQSSEVLNNMLFLASNKKDIIKWKDKEKFPPDSKVRKELENVDKNYKEVYERIKCFFDDYDKMIKDSHKIIHKQGFDTFYKFHIKKTEEEIKNIIKMFEEMIKMSICKIYIFLFVLDPLSLLLVDEDVYNKIYFNTITTAINTKYLSQNYHLNLVDELKTKFYISLKDTYLHNKEINQTVFDVKREQFFDIDNLEKIEEQLYILDYTEKYMFNILKLGLKISEFHIDECMVLPYFTSIPSSYVRNKWTKGEFDNYCHDKIYNIPYNTVYLSILNMFGNKLYLQHNEILSAEEILKLIFLEKKLNEQYKTFSI